MLLMNEKKEANEGSRGLKMKPLSSPKLKSFKIAYRKNRQAKLISMFQDIVINDLKPQDCRQNLSKVTQGGKSIKSSYLMYKEKQKSEKQKLQEVHTFEKPKIKLDQLYCTLRIRDSRAQKRLPKQLSQTLQLGTLNSVRSQMHDRDQMKKDSPKTPRDCRTQNVTRKLGLPRKYSVDTNVSSSKFLIRKNSANGNHEFQGPCRPWSPADFVEPAAFATDENLTII